MTWCMNSADVALGDVANPLLENKYPARKIS